VFYTSPRTSSLRTRTDSPTPGRPAPPDWDTWTGGLPALVGLCTGGTLHWWDFQDGGTSSCAAVDGLRGFKVSYNLN